MIELIHVPTTMQRIDFLVKTLLGNVFWRHVIAIYDACMSYRLMVLTVKIRSAFSVIYNYCPVTPNRYLVITINFDFLVNFEFTYVPFTCCYVMIYTGLVIGGIITNGYLGAQSVEISMVRGV